MSQRMSEVSMIWRESSSIKSPKWQTSGITSGTQVISATAGLPFWPREASTAIESPAKYHLILEENVLDISRLILEDDDFRHSIEKAKEEMKKGGPYLSHEDVFGE